MKRINPETGKPFKWGHPNKEGLIFRGYQLKREKTKEGFFKETWSTPEAFSKSLKIRQLRKEKFSDYWSNYNKTVVGRAKKLVKAASLRARKKKLLFNLQWQDVEQILKQGKCQLTGLPFCFEQTVEFKSHPFAPSLDRINSKEGYLKDNTRVILHSLNAALNEYGQDHLIKIVEAMKENLYGKETKF